MRAGPLITALCLLAPVTRARAQTDDLREEVDRMFGSSGHFVASIGEAKDPKNKPYQEPFSTNPMLQTLAKALTNEFSIAEDVTLATRECGRASSTNYDPVRREVILCYEDIPAVIRALEKSHMDEKDAIGGAIGFMIFHEVGHALIHILNLPVLGRQEDVADDIAAVFLIEEGPTAVMVEHGARMFFAMDRANRKFQRQSFWDEHSLDLQRAYSLVCMLYGKDPVKYRDLMRKSRMPRDRAESCAEDYRLKLASWNNLMRVHRKVKPALTRSLPTNPPHLLSTPEPEPTPINSDPSPVNTAAPGDPQR